MPIAALNNLTKSFGHKALFEKLNLSIYRGQRIGLIGANGSGKTTLLRILLGETVPDDGVASIRKGVSVGHLEQNPTFTPGNTVMDEAEEAFADLKQLSHRMRDLEHEMAHLEGDDLLRVLDQYQTVQHDFELAGGYAWRHRLEATLHGVGLDDEMWEQKVETLSGGQRSRLALARALVGEPDILLLDEPTNHLDLAAVEWLEDYLADYKGAVLLISHDRYLLDRLATRIAWLQYARLMTFDGNYSHYVEQRELLELTQERAYEQQQKDIAKTEEFIRRFKAGQRSKEAKGREKRLDRLKEGEALLAAVRPDKAVHIAFATPERRRPPAERTQPEQELWPHAAVGWRHIRDDPRRARRHHRPQRLRKDHSAGNPHRPPTTRPRHGAAGLQHQPGLLRADTPGPQREEHGIRRSRRRPEAAPAAHPRHAGRPAPLRRPGRQADFCSLRRRARSGALAQLLLDKPNVLVMDEPTNHLDIAACEALERTLADFPGTILCVSHDRYFLNKIATRLLILRPPSMVDFDGNYTAWHERCVAETAAASHRQAAAKEAARKATHAVPKPVGKPTTSGGHSRSDPTVRPVATPGRTRKAAADWYNGEHEHQINPVLSRHARGPECDCDAPGGRASGNQDEGPACADRRGQGRVRARGG